MYNKEINDSLKMIERIQNEFTGIVESELEGFDVTRTSSQGLNFQVGFYDKYKSLKETSYYISDNLELLHFTSLPVLFSMLNQRIIRLYNLLNSNDPTEYQYASEQFGHDAIRNIIKRTTYTFSMTTPDEIENEFMWEKYANNKHGVALKFSIANDREKWEHFYLSNVKYGELENISSLNAKLIALKQRNPNCTFRVEFDHVLALHKAYIEKWTQENETRILGRPSWDTNTRSSKVFNDYKPNSDGNGYRFTEYIQLPIWLNMVSFHRHFQNSGYDPDNNSYESIPLLKLESIYFHKELADKLNWRTFHPELERLIQRRLGYKVSSAIIDA